MKFFLDTADLAEIEEAASWGALAGVTTNPSLYAKIGGKLDTQGVNGRMQARSKYGAKRPKKK